MTEEEAKTKWCPFARVVEIGDGTLWGPFNRYWNKDAPNLKDNTQARCIGSACMAWRQNNFGDGCCGLAGEP